LFNGTDTRADALLIGCALGMAFTLPAVRENVWVQRFCRHAALPCVLLLLLGGYTLHWQLRGMYAGTSVFFMVVSALLVAALVLPQRTFAHRIFELPPLVFLGRICYGLYLWHFPIYNVLRFGFELPLAGVAGLGVPLTFAAAILSYRYIERPFLAIKDRMPESKA
jgi:peptidoglycan/LPS O-acetylase OafA/YrhL